MLLPPIGLVLFLDSELVGIKLVVIFFIQFFQSFFPVSFCSITTRIINTSLTNFSNLRFCCNALYIFRKIFGNARTKARQNFSWYSPFLFLQIHFPENNKKNHNISLLCIYCKNFRKRLHQKLLLNNPFAYYKTLSERRNRINLRRTILCDFF